MRQGETQVETRLKGSPSKGQNCPKSRGEYGSKSASNPIGIEFVQKAELMNIGFQRFFVSA